MRHSITIDGEERVIDIRAMDEGFIVYRKMFAPPLTPENIGQVNPGDPEGLRDQLAGGRLRIIERFFRKQVRVIGSCMILAWEGNGVIGKMHFTTREMHEALNGCVQYGGSYCVDDSAAFAAAIESFSDEELDRLLRPESRTLRVLCFNVGHFDKRYQGKGIAKAMLEHLKEWARERRWRRIEAHSCPDITPTNVIGDWMLRRGALERRGFYVLEQLPAPEAEVQKRLRVINDLAGRGQDLAEEDDWYVRNFARVAANPAWRAEYDKNYLMACDL